jgi:hypothetical protein
MAAKTHKKRQPGAFGAVETLPSGRHRARYRGRMTLLSGLFRRLLTDPGQAVVDLDDDGDGIL